MTISVKPKQQHEDVIKKIIQGGGASPIREDELPKRKMISMKLDVNLLQKIDQCVLAERKKNYNYNRQQWIIEAMEQKIKNL